MRGIRASPDWASRTPKNLLAGFQPSVLIRGWDLGGKHLRSFVFAAASAVALGGMSAAAVAETKLASLPPRVLAFDREAPGSRTLVKDDVLWKAPLRWPKAAILEQSAQLAADDRRANIAAGDVLAQTRLLFDDLTLASATSFCVARLADPTKATGGLLGGILARSLTDGQFCIIDKDNDGIADMSVLINAGSPAARMPVAIAPLRYRTDVGVEVGPGDYARLIYRGGQKFELEFYQQGSKRRFDTFTTSGNYGRETFSSWIRRTKLGDGNQIFVTPSGKLRLRSFDKASGALTVDWDGRARLKLMPVPDEVRTTIRYY
jgi:hypothetical protein